MRHVTGALAAMAVLAAAGTAAAVEIAPLTYEVQTPNNGTYAYQDDTYSGTNTAGYLSGGTGDLTDGVIAGAHWYDTPVPWVGWQNTAPTILFHFAPGTTLNFVDFYFDDAQGAGGVSLPAAVSLTNGGTPFVVLPTITSVGVSGRYRYDLGGMAVTDLGATLVPSNEWVMLTEVDFDGSAGGVPEPASWALMIGGFGLAGFTLRRRRTQAA